MATTPKKDKKFIQKAIKNPGALTAKAKAAGMTVDAYAQKVTAPNSTADATTKKEANFYLNVLKPAAAKKKTSKKKVAGSGK